MAPRFNTFLLALAIALPAALCAQSAEVVIEQEHRYQFAVQGDLSTYQEKLLVEQMMFNDPRMRVNVDRPHHLMKVLAYRPLDPQSIIELAAKQGVTLTPRRRFADPSPILTPQQ